jgi:peptidoglycan/xylan/chitin deacetylase (PgdA/CDA1 family)
MGPGEKVKMSQKSVINFNFVIDCESTQPAIRDAALGIRSVLKIADILEARGAVGTYQVLPSDIEASPRTYLELVNRGHDVGLHTHPACEGECDFLGVYGPEDQDRIIGAAVKRFTDAMGRFPDTYGAGYGSVNDFTYGIIYKNGFRNGITALPGRVARSYASFHAGKLEDVHYAHPYNRLLAGGLDFVEIPLTVDQQPLRDLKGQPLDLRVEHVDLPGQARTIGKAIARQLANQAPVKVIRGLTHSTVDYSDPTENRLPAFLAMIQESKDQAGQAGLQWEGAGARRIAELYRKAVPDFKTGDVFDMGKAGQM